MGSTLVPDHHINISPGGLVTTERGLWVPRNTHWETLL